MLLRRNVLLPDFENLFTERNRVANKPSVNLIEKEKSYMIEVAAPGLGKEDFSIEVDNEVLSISAEKKQEDRAEEVNYTRFEFDYSSFKRSFILPEEANREKISAVHKNGILSIEISKREEALPKKPYQVKVA